MIKLTSFNLEKIQLEGKHYGLVQNMSIDNKIKLYIEKDFFDWLKKHQASSNDQIDVGKMYVVSKDGREYGIVGSEGINEDGYLDVVYAIKKNMRDRGYGTKVLEEITPYLLEHVKDIKGIHLRIDESNKGSKGIAMKNGYIEKTEEKENGVESWYYYNDMDKKHGRAK